MDSSALGRKKGLLDRKIQVVESIVRHNRNRSEFRPFLQGVGTPRGWVGDTEGAFEDPSVDVRIYSESPFISRRRFEW